MAINEIDLALHAFLGLLPARAAAPLRKVLSLDGGAELLKNIIASAVDPSTVTIDQIKEEREKSLFPSDYGW